MSTRKKNPNLVAGQTIGGTTNPDFIAGVHDAILHHRLHLRPPKRLDKGEDHQVADLSYALLGKTGKIT
jgi:hypothetical protein